MMKKTNVLKAVCLVSLVSLVSVSPAMAHKLKKHVKKGCFINQQLTKAQCKSYMGTAGAAVPGEPSVRACSTVPEPGGLRDHIKNVGNINGPEENKAYKKCIKKVGRHYKRLKKKFK